MRSRKSNRCKKHDYSEPGLYFITIVTKDNKPWFGDIDNGFMRLNNCGKVADQCWQCIPAHFEGVACDEYIIMPDHVHGILCVGAATHVGGDNNAHVGAADLRPQQMLRPPHSSSNRSKMILSKIVHGYKSSVSRIIHGEHNNDQFQWQRSFHDRVIRNNDELNDIRNYIRNNPHAK